MFLNYASVITNMILKQNIYLLLHQIKPQHFLINLYGGRASDQFIVENSGFMKAITDKALNYSKQRF